MSPKDKFVVESDVLLSRLRRLSGLLDFAASFSNKK